MEDIELALHSVPDIHDVHKGSKVITELILLADKHQVSKGGIKNFSQPLRNTSKRELKKETLYVSPITLTHVFPSSVKK